MKREVKSFNQAKNIDDCSSDHNGDYYNDDEIKDIISYVFG